MTTSEQIIQVIDALCEKFGIAIDWTSKNIVPYVETLCKKLVTYEICTSIICIVFMILLGVASIIAAKRLTPIFKEGLKRDRQSYCDFGWIVGTPFAIVGLIIIGIIIIGTIGQQIMDIVKCAVFPEMYIFEYIKKLSNIVA